MELPDPDDGHLELIAGEVIHVAGGNSDHSTIVGRLNRRLGRFVDDHDLGELLGEASFHLRADDPWAPVPDLAFATHERYRKIYRKGAFFEGAPELMVEVVSKTNSDREISRKVLVYLESGAERVWVVRPEQMTVTVYRGDMTARLLREQDVLTSDDAGFPAEGFALKVADIFP